MGPCNIPCQCNTRHPDPHTCFPAFAQGTHRLSIISWSPHCHTFSGYKATRLIVHCTAAFDVSGLLAHGLSNDGITPTSLPSQPVPSHSARLESDTL